MSDISYYPFLTKMINERASNRNEEIILCITVRKYLMSKKCRAVFGLESNLE